MTAKTALFFLSLIVLSTSLNLHMRFALIDLNDRNLASRTKDLQNGRIIIYFSSNTVTHLYMLAFDRSHDYLHVGQLEANS